MASAFFFATILLEFRVTPWKETLDGMDGRCYTMHKKRSLIEKPAISQNFECLFRKGVI